MTRRIRKTKNTVRIPEDKLSCPHCNREMLWGEFYDYSHECIRECQRCNRLRHEHIAVMAADGSVFLLCSTNVFKE